MRPTPFLLYISLCVLKVAIFFSGTESTAVYVPRYVVRRVAPNYYLGKRAAYPEEEKRWGFDSITDSLSDTAAGAISDLGDLANDAADTLTDTAMEKVEFLDENGVPMSLDEVKQMTDDAAMFLDENGVPLSLDEVQEIADELTDELALEDVKNLAEQIPVEDIADLGGDVLSQFSAGVEQESMESTMLSIEILEKLTDAKILIEQIEMCKSGEAVDVEDEEAKREMPTEELLATETEEEKRGAIMREFIGKRDDETDELIDLAQDDKRGSHMREFIGKRGDLMREFIGKRGDLMREFIGKRGDLMRWFIGKRGDLMREFIGKRSEGAAGEEDGMLSGVIDAAGSLTSLLPIGGGSPQSAGDTASLYTILEGLNEIVARLELLI